MSVIYFTDEELSCIYENLADRVKRDKIDISSSEESLCCFITRLGFYNRLAYRFTYLNGKGEISLAIPDFKTEDMTELSLKKLVEKLSLLEYNCVTNSGMCFMDAKDKKKLEDILYSLKERYIRSLEWQLKKKS